MLRKNLCEFLKPPYAEQQAGILVIKPAGPYFKGNLETVFELERATTATAKNQELRLV